MGYMGYIVHCPKCKKQHEVSLDDDFVSCECGTDWQIQWGVCDNHLRMKDSSGYDIV